MATRVAALYVTVLVTIVPEAVARSVMFAALIVAGSIASLNVIVTSEFGATPVAPFAGVVEVTVGGRSSRVVNVHTFASARLLPARSFAPVLIVAVIEEKFGSPPVGTRTARRVSALYVTVAGRAAPFVMRIVNVDPLMVAGSIGSLKMTFTSAAGET